MPLDRVPLRDNLLLLLAALDQLGEDDRGRFFVTVNVVARRALEDIAHPALQ